MNNIINKLLGALEDNAGGLSSSRCLMLVWGVVVLGVWAYISIHTGGLVSIPSEAVTILLGLVGFKTVQRFGEKGETVMVDNSAKTDINVTTTKS